MSFDLSVVFPTYRRPDTLSRVLDALKLQTGMAGRFQTVVADDGSADTTVSVLKEYVKCGELNLKWLSLEQNSGPAIARNSAIRLADGHVIIIIGDDMVPGSDFVFKHFEWHEKHPDENQAVLGSVLWPEAINPSGFMRWLEGRGRNFYFNLNVLRAARGPVSSEFFYTSNVSLKRSFIMKSPLCSEMFRYASHEDLQLGDDLRKMGMKLFFDSSMPVSHWHYLTIKGMAMRVYLMGYSAPLYWQKVPDSATMFKKIFRETLVFFSSLEIGRHTLLGLLSRQQDEQGCHHFYWSLLLSLCYCAGLSDRRRNRPVRSLQG
jgi:glycosyltransferase involved in cell wall biosynthesis